MAKKNSVKETFWMGMDLGGTKMYAVVYNHDFEALGSSRKKTKANKGQEEGGRRLLEVAGAALEDAGITAEQLSGIGLGAPGPLDVEKGIILNTPNLGWKNMAVVKLLKDHFGCPAFLLNDVDSGLYGEYAFGAASGARCAMGIFPGTGIGGACVYEGRLLQGRSQSAMEIGHMQVQPDGPLCGCGKRGCLESVASRLSIASAAAAAAARGEAPALLKLAGTDVSEIRSGALKKSVAAGDVVVERILIHAAQWIGVATAGVVNLLLPEVVVLGGGLIEAMPKLFCDEVERVARSRCMVSFKDTFKVCPAKLGDEAGVMGAASWACKQVEG